MDELKVGISQYVTLSDPLMATFKYRMTDFFVQEIDLDSNLVTFSADPKKGGLIRIKCSFGGRAKKGY